MRPCRSVVSPDRATFPTRNGLRHSPPGAGLPRRLAAYDDPREVFDALRWIAISGTPAKRKKGSKVHAAVDTLGHLLALRGTPAIKEEGPGTGGRTGTIGWRWSSTPAP